MQPTEQLQVAVDDMKQQITATSNVHPPTAESKEAITRKIQSLRSELRTISAQTARVDAEVLQVRGDVEAREAKCGALHDMYHRMKSNNDTKAQMHRWSSVAFIDAVGSADAHLSIAESTRVMSTHFSPDIAVSDARVREVLAQVYPATVSHIISHGLTLEQFCTVVDTIDPPSL